MTVAPSDVYISADLEADGRLPGQHSMLSFGLSVAGAYDGETFERRDPEATTFYRELKPISEEWEPEALAVAGLDRNHLLHHGADPAVAMTEARKWVRAVAGKSRPVLVAYPLAFDWLFLYWYFTRFAEGGSPFGFSSCLDMKTMYAVKAKVVITRSTKSQMPPFLLSRRPHQHHALADAIEQAELFANLFEWQPNTSAAANPVPFNS